MLIFNRNDIYHICRLNLKGELVFKRSLDDKDIFRKIYKLLDNKLNKSKFVSGEERVTTSVDISDKLKLSKVFCGSRKGELYRLIAYKNI